MHFAKLLKNIKTEVGENNSLCSYAIKVSSAKVGRNLASSKYMDKDAFLVTRHINTMFFNLKA